MKYILNNDNLEVVGKQYLKGVGGYDGTNPTAAKSVQEVINELVDIINQIIIERK